MEPTRHEFLLLVRFYFRLVALTNVSLHEKHINFEAFKSKSKASDDLSVKKSIVRLIWTKNTFSGENWTSPTSEMASQKNIFWTKKSFHCLNQLNKYKSKILWSNLLLDKREGTRTSRHLEISSVRWQLPMISTPCPSQICSFKNKNII